MSDDYKRPVSVGAWSATAPLSYAAYGDQAASKLWLEHNGRALYWVCHDNNTPEKQAEFDFAVAEWIFETEHARSQGARIPHYAEQLLAAARALGYKPPGTDEP